MLEHECPPVLSAAATICQDTSLLHSGVQYVLVEGNAFQSNRCTFNLNTSVSAGSYVLRPVQLHIY